MSKKPKDKFYANEAFLAKAKAEGRVRRVRLPIAGLKVDYKHYQPRVVHLDMDHVRDLSRILMDDDANGNPTELEPIIVFEFASGDRVPADGFHRIGAYKKAGRDMIPCDVIAKGTKQEAIEFAAACNQRSMLKRTREDARKAVWMLLDNGWFDRSTEWIAKVVGVGSGSVLKYRQEYCDARQIDQPAKVYREDGRQTLRPGRLPRLRVCKREGDRQTRFKVKMDGKNIDLGVDEAVAREKYAQLLASREYCVTSMAGGGFAPACASRGVIVTSANAGPINGLRYHESIIIPIDSFSYQSLMTAISRGLILANHCNLRRVVIVRSRIGLSNCGAIERLASRLGVEFMTLDEFVAAVKADEASQAEGRAS